MAVVRCGVDACMPFDFHFGLYLSQVQYCNRTITWAQLSNQVYNSAGNSLLGLKNTNGWRPCRDKIFRNCSTPKSVHLLRGAQFYYFLLQRSAQSAVSNSHGKWIAAAQSLPGDCFYDLEFRTKFHGTNSSQHLLPDQLTIVHFSIFLIIYSLEEGGSQKVMNTKPKIHESRKTI